jgi:hypothetical protein
MGKSKRKTAKKTEEKIEEIAQSVMMEAPVIPEEETITEAEPEEKPSLDEESTTEAVTGEVAEGLVTVKVKFGSVRFDDRKYEKGDVFTIPKSRAERLDQRFLQYI